MQITTQEQLRALYAEPSERARRKQLAALDRHCRAFIALSPFVLLATSDAAGRVDVSPRGGAPGFVVVPTSPRIRVAVDSGVQSHMTGDWT